MDEGAWSMGGDGAVGEPPGTQLALLAADETTVVVRARGGSTQAFELLIDRYQVPLFRHSLRLLADRGAAEDVVQETFVAAWRGLPGLGEPSAFRGWLYRIATRHCFDVLRARRPRPQWAEEDQDEPGGIDSASRGQADPAQVVVHRAQFEALQEALATLPPQQRAAWTMQRMDGLSYDEIATALGLPVSTVRGRIARARQTLAERMAAWR